MSCEDNRRGVSTVMKAMNNEVGKDATLRLAGEVANYLCQKHLLVKCKH